MKKVMNKAENFVDEMIEGILAVAMIERPWINMNNSILDINDGKTRIKVDWWGDYPVIKRGG